MNRLMRYLHRDYHGVKEMQEITNSKTEELFVLDDEIHALRDNQYIQTLHEDGVRYWEEKIDIIPNPQTESLSFRRERLLNRAGMRPPYTEGFLRRRLDKLIGKGRYTLEIDYDNYTIYVESSAENQGWYNEVRVTINKVKPCNMVFINKPYAVNEILISSEVSYSQKTYNYRLGTSWRLGQLPFASVQSKGVVKLPEILSLKPDMLSNVAAFTADNITKIRINESVEITDFVTKYALGAEAVIEYSVTPVQAAQITKIQVFDENDNLLDESDLYIPVSETAIVKHIIRIREGV